LTYKYAVLVFIGFFIWPVACKNKNSVPEPPAGLTDTLPDRGKSILYETAPAPIINSAPLWKMEITNAGMNRMRKVRVPDSAELTPAYLIALINTKTENVQCFLKKISNDTIFISIPNSEFLSQRMGSTGAEIYMAETVYTLTELKGVRYVHFDFEEGDHAIPGAYRRKDFR
jgi:hypothetical protein